MTDTVSFLPEILVVDDSKMIRLSLKKILQGEFAIVEAEDGVQAMESLAASDRIQVVITDAGMPNMDGYELIQAMREHEDTRFRQTPIIMVSGAEDAKSREKALSIGATDFILKPFDKAELLARVRSQVRLDQTTRDLSSHSTENPVTGLYSRHYLLERGNQDLSLARRQDSEMTVMCLALDQLPTLRQQAPGDALNGFLKDLAAVLKSQLRQGDTLAHIEEDRFVILSPGAGTEAAVPLCQRLRQQVMSLNSPVGALTISIGVIFRHEKDLQGFEEYLQLAELRLSQGMQQGGNRIIMEQAAQRPQAPQISLDAVTRLLQKGDSEKLAPYTDMILQKVIPMLEFCDRHDQLGIAAEIEALRKRLK